MAEARSSTIKWGFLSRSTTCAACGHFIEGGWFDNPFQCPLCFRYFDIDGKRAVEVVGDKRGWYRIPLQENGNDEMPSRCPECGSPSVGRCEIKSEEYRVGFSYKAYRAIVPLCPKHTNPNAELQRMMLKVDYLHTPYFSERTRYLVLVVRSYQFYLDFLRANLG